MSLLPACISPYTCSFSAQMLYLERRLIYSSLGFASWLAALHSSPSCAATHSKNQQGELQHFSVCHSECVARSTASGSIRFVVEVLCSCIHVYDRSAPFKHDGFAEHVQTIWPGKPQRKALALIAHTGRQQSCLSTGTDSRQVRVDLKSGRAFPDGYHISGVTGLFVLNWILQHSSSKIWGWFGFCSVCVTYPSEQHRL